jgi:hypothetical protein
MLMSLVPSKKTTINQLTRHLAQADVTILASKNVDMVAEFLGYYWIFR